MEKHVTNLYKSPQELAKEMNKALKDNTQMTEEEIREDDADGGYFHDDDND